MEGWAEWSLARSWLRRLGRHVVESILLIITGYVLLRLGMEDDPAMGGLVAVLAVAVAVVVVGLIMMLMSTVRYQGNRVIGM